MAEPRLLLRCVIAADKVDIAGNRASAAAVEVLAVAADHYHIVRRSDVEPAVLELRSALAAAGASAETVGIPRHVIQPAFGLIAVAHSLQAPDVVAVADDGLLLERGVVEAALCGVTLVELAVGCDAPAENVYATVKFGSESGRIDALQVSENEFERLACGSIERKMRLEGFGDRIACVGVGLAAEKKERKGCSEDDVFHGAKIQKIRHGTLRAG